MIIFVTGEPGSGKSSLAMSIAKRFGDKVGGITTPDIRDGKRTGFRIMDLVSGEWDVMASTKIKGPMVSKYGVNVEAVDEIGTAAIKSAIADSGVELIVIDELGKMELFSEKFKEAVKEAMGCGKKLLVVLQRDMINDYKDFGRLFVLTSENREQVKEAILELLGA